MYEISLVPDIKAALLHKQRLRNLFILIAIGVGVACGAVVLVLVGIMGGQKIGIAEQKKEIGCRYDMKSEGKTLTSRDCQGKGIAVMQFDNMQTLLTIQDQLKSLDTLNNSMIKFSRIFGLLDVLLLDEEDGEKIQVSELAADFSTMTISFDAVGYDNSSAQIGYKPLETFKKNTEKMYYDYGEYMRRDEEGNDVVIPHFCITETTVNGLVYGVYHKGTPGCEAPMVEYLQDGKEESEDEEESKEESEEESEEEEKEEIEQKDIYIRRTYRNLADLEKVREGNDEYWNEDLMGKNDYKGFFFESKCLIWGEDEKGTFDENATIETCPFLSDAILINNSSYGTDAEDKKVLTFQASVPISVEIFLSGSHNMQIIGPTRQNVTDSYVQVRDMFVSGDSIEKEVK